MKLESKFNKFAQEGGFTLIEMLIVVAIIGILVAIAVPALNTAKADAQTAKLKAAQSAVSLAKNRYFLSPLTPVSNLAATSPSTLAQISPYLIINGVQATTWSQVFAGTSMTSGANEAAAFLNLSLTTNYSGL